MLVFSGKGEKTNKNENKNKPENHSVPKTVHKALKVDVITANADRDWNRLTHPTNFNGDRIQRRNLRLLQSPPAPRTVSNMHTQVAWAQSSANHVQHMEY